MPKTRAGIKCTAKGNLVHRRTEAVYVVECCLYPNSFIAH